MNEKINVIISAVSMTMTAISVIFGIRTAFKKSEKQFLDNKINEEKRFLNSEERLAIIEERMSLNESTLTSRLDEISDRINSLHNKFYEFIIKNNY